MAEIGKDIKGYENKYQVSNLGNVRALNYRNGGVVSSVHQKDTHGYRQVALWKDAKRKMFGVHRLVAEAFIPNPNNLPQINHKDEDKANNCVDNLEWCSQLYNNLYGTRIQRVEQSKKHIAGEV